MPSTEAPNWWADVQQEREDLAGPGRRPAEDWLGEEIDFVPRRRMRRRDHAEDSARAGRLTRDARGGSGAGADHELHGVFVSADADAAAAMDGATSRAIELELVPAAGDRAAREVVAATPADVAHELRHLRAADDPFATPPPPPGVRRTIQIKGRPGGISAPSLARRHRPRTASDRVGHRPDRIALWAVVLGAVLILLAAASASSQAAVAHRALPAPAAHHAKVTHAAHHAPARLMRVHR
jgi:hypothetical protein